MTACLPACELSERLIANTKNAIQSPMSNIAQTGPGKIRPGMPKDEEQHAAETEPCLARHVLDADVDDGDPVRAGVGGRHSRLHVLMTFDGVQVPQRRAVVELVEHDDLHRWHIWLGPEEADATS